MRLIVCARLQCLWVGRAGVSKMHHTGRAYSRHSRLPLVLALATTMVLLLTSCDWYQFGGGPAHTRSSNDNGIALTNASGLVQRWSAATGGAVESSPAVSNGLAYVGSNDGKVYAFNAGTGAATWSGTTGGAVGSSPAVANGTVFVGSDDHNLYAFRASDGSPLWSVPVDATFAGLSALPTVSGSVVYVSSATTLYAFRASDGAVQWSTVVSASGAVSPPSVDNGLVYVESYADARLSAFRADTGALAWSVTAAGTPNPTGCGTPTPTPAVAGSVVYVALCPTTGGGGASVFAYSTADGSLVWSAGGATASTSPAVGNGTVFVASSASTVITAYSASSGATLWTADVGGSGVSSPALANGVLYIGSDDHNLYAFDAAGTSGCTGTPKVCSPQLSAATGGAIRSSPAVAGGQIFVGSDDGALHAYGLPSIGFGKSVLQGTISNSATTLRFGPDGRLYVGQFSGLIKAYTIRRDGANAYSVTATETINLIQRIPNHDDDGTPNASVTTRLLTALTVAGSAANPVLYVSSTDPRIGGGSSGTLTSTDTNGSVISRLTRSGGVWSRQDLVRGLPRSQENHATNALVLDQTTNTLYAAQGGNTNLGAPSHNFNYLPEYAYSAAILKVDLNAIGAGTYDLPTLTDENHPTLTGPFGGDFGRHQAKITTGSPVQVYAPGFRNPFSLVRTDAGRLYSADNGSNAGWGDIPIGAGPGGTCTNAPHDPGSSQVDSLHLIARAGYYGGHANPTRGNRNNTFNTTNPQSPVPVANPVECDARDPSRNGSLTTFNTATTGMAEYTASNFANQMKGDLLVASYYGSLIRVRLNAGGNGVVSNDVLFTNAAVHALDVAVQRDGDAFPGTIWVADFSDGSVHVFEPNDFGGRVAPPCSGARSSTLDEDRDGFTNADELDNGTDPCSAADTPHDWNGNFVSDRNDPNDDSAGLPDTSDPFAIDANDGVTTPVPRVYSWKSGSTNPCAPTPIPSGCPGGLLQLGFTGVMTDGSTNYADLFDETKMTVGGAAGVVTIDQVPPGDAYGTANTQRYGLQFGVNAYPASTGVFTAHTRISGPFSGITPQGNQSMGLYIGTGDQDNYAKLVVTANNGSPGVQFVKEVSAVDTTRPVADVPMPGPDSVDLYLTVDPSAGTVTPSYRVTSGGTPGPLMSLGGSEPIPASWLTTAGRGLATGIISTSAGGPVFSATWELLEVTTGSAQ